MAVAFIFAVNGSVGSQHMLAEQNLLRNTTGRGGEHMYLRYMTKLIGRISSVPTTSIGKSSSSWIKSAVSISATLTSPTCAAYLGLRSSFFRVVCDVRKSLQHTNNHQGAGIAALESEHESLKRKNLRQGKALGMLYQQSPHR